MHILVGIRMVAHDREIPTAFNSRRLHQPVWRFVVSLHRTGQLGLKKSPPQIKNVHQVSLEAGNSPQMVFAHYRQLVTETQATEWFGILPTKDWKNITFLPADTGMSQSAVIEDTTAARA